MSKRGRKKKSKKSIKKRTQRKGYKREVNKRMRNYGDIDFEKKVIRVNPKHGDLLNTILHEEAHRRYPDKSEKEIKKISKKQEAKLTMGKAVKLMKKYMKSKQDKE